MKKYYIFLDTNIIQHTLTHHEKGKLIWLHKINADFYDIGNLYILPQVITELNEFDSNIFDFLKTTYSFVDSFDVKILSDDQAFHANFLNAALGNIFLLVQTKITWYKSHIIDTFLFLESMYPNTIELQEIKKWLENNEWITFNQDYGYNYSEALANVIEGTWLGTMTYGSFTYRDIFRSTGNFMFDYKNYLNKWERQKSKVWKDAQVICELVFWMDSLKTIPIDQNLIFISSDYDFLKEVKKFQNDCITWTMFESEYYKWLSTSYIFQLKLVMQNLKVIKLDPVTFVFKTDLWESHKILELV